MYYLMWLLSKLSLIKICFDGNDVDDIVTDLTAFLICPPFLAFAYLHLLSCNTGINIAQLCTIDKVKIL